MFETGSKCIPGIPSVAKADFKILVLLRPLRYWVCRCVPQQLGRFLEASSGDFKCLREHVPGTEALSEGEKEFVLHIQGVAYV